MVGWGAFLLPLLVLIVGPTEFITNSIINAIGLTTQNFLQMSLFTDPLGDGSFTRNWTVFYWLWWISYTHGVAMFVTRVSRGRKIKEVIWGLILGSTVGCWFFFGVMESYAIHQFINGVINVPQVLETLGGETAVQQVLMSLPAGKLFLAAYTGVMIIFLASHMDAVAYTMAATSTRNLREGDDPDRGLRLFWCVVITLIPLSILFTGASLETMKTTVVLTALPFLVILLVKVGGFIRWLKQDYADIPAHQVEHYLPQTPVEATEKTPVLLREPYSKATTERHHPNDKGIPMSNLSPDFVLPENFCANPQEAWTIPARFYTDQNAFEHEKRTSSPKAGFASLTAANWRMPMIM